MRLSYIKKNILDTDCDAIIHGCNCFKTMGAGVAKAIKSKWPGVYLADSSSPLGPQDKLGAFTFYMPEDSNSPSWIFNAYTQYRYGWHYNPQKKRKVAPVDYDAIESSLYAIRNYLKSYAIEHNFDSSKEITIAMPRIGCGLAGGRWEVVEKIITSVFCEDTSDLTDQPTFHIVIHELR